MQYVCPECERLNMAKFVFESEIIEQLGFNSSEEKRDSEEWAGNGLCINLTCIEDWCAKRNFDSRFKMGVPLTPQVPTHEHVAEAKYETVYKCEECNIGEYTFNPNNRNHECDNAFCGSVRYDLEQPNSSKSGGGLGDKGYELRNSYMKALLERSEVVEPPYLFDKSPNPFLQNRKEVSVKLEEEEFHTSQKRSLSWFKCLHHHLKPLEDLKGTRFQKIVLSAYMDKTLELQHIEPLWMYAQRAKLGGELKSAFTIFENNPELFSELIEKKKHVLQPDEASLQCVYGLIKSLLPWPGDRIKDETIIMEAANVLKKLSSKGFIEQMNKFNLIVPTYSFNGQIQIPIGLIECICIINAVENHSGIDKFGIDVKNAIFPNRSEREHWKSIMTSKGKQFVDVIIPKLASNYLLLE